MESEGNKYVLNPNTNRYVLKGTALHKRLVKSGALSQQAEFKAPALVVTKQVKAIANVKDLNKTEQDDIYHQLKSLRERRDEIVARRGRPEGKSMDTSKPTVKGLLKSKPINKFNISIKPSKASTDTEYDLNED
jgi:hypothetical protein